MGTIMMLLQHFMKVQPIEKRCPVCEEEAVEWYSLSPCQHLFCKPCCLNYIESQANNFSEAKCLKEGCNSKLDQTKPIYTLLDPDTKHKIHKFNFYKYLQENPQFKGCRVSECSGFFSKRKEKGSKPTCNVCQAQHCRKCFELKHPGECKVSKQDQQMRQLNYNKCPKCAVWVEKAAGCQFITCKCGTDFCFACGVEFYKDPCRKRELWREEEQIREKLSKIVIRPPSDTLGYFLLIPKLALKAILMVLATLVCGTIPFVGAFIAAGSVISLVAPCALCTAIHRQIHEPCLRVIASLVWILFYPLLCGLSLLIYLSIAIMYPFCRRAYHHGVYDPIDRFISKLANCYLSVIIRIIDI